MPKAAEHMDQHSVQNDFRTMQNNAEVLSKCGYSEALRRTLDCNGRTTRAGLNLSRKLLLSVRQKCWCSDKFVISGGSRMFGSGLRAGSMSPSENSSQLRSVPAGASYQAQRRPVQGQRRRRDPRHWEGPQALRRTCPGE